METQTDRVVTIGELPLILKEEPAVRRTIIRILRDRFAERDITEDRFEHLFRELKEGREESRKRWEEQTRKSDKKWEEQTRKSDKKWEEQNKKWEEQTRKSDKKWEEQNKKWEEQTRKWDKKWEEQDKKWEEQNKKWEEQDKKWERTEHRLDRLEKIVGELALAQKRTEERVEELAQAQKRTEERVEELALAQKRTEEALRTLTATVEDVKKGLGDVRKQVGGLSMTVGYGLEDKLFPYVRDFVKKEFGAEMTVTDRRNLIYPDGKYDEINIYAEGTKDGHTLFIIGECKAQPGKKDFDRMEQMLARVKKVVNGDIHPFLVGYHFSPDVEAYAEKTYPHIRICKSFEFGLKYKKI